ncbi:MAG: beta-propeller fold lactonase family protein [Bryobacterales bacterium]|nr:beta-propeller fold lactonase family protein [Bryobacterales bacterium]
MMRLQLRWALIPAAVLATTSLLAPPPARAQQTLTTIPGASFGELVPFDGQPSEIVLDEARKRVYAVSSGGNRVRIYNYELKQVVGEIEVGTFPSGAAMSPDGRFLYVANVQSSTLSVIDLERDGVSATVSLPAKPEGVGVGSDGRVLITTQGAGTNNALNTLLIFDPSQEAGQQLIPVSSPPTISTPAPLPAIFAGRPSTPFPGRLIATPDGQFIVGMVAINQQLNTAQTTLFVYETASGTVLRNRTVTGQSTVLSISPDGTRFMAGSTLYDTATLNVIGQVNVNNYPFILTTNATGANASNQAINLNNNVGGTVFSANGETVYGAFNINPAAVNAGRPLADALILMSSRHLGVRMGLRMPESILGKIVLTQDGETMIASSESGIIVIPIGQLFEQPLLAPETTTVFLASDLCNKGIARATVRINNIGSGKLTYTVPAVTTALVTEVTSGLAPSSVSFVMEPGRSGVQRRPGTNNFAVAASGNALPINVVLNSREAINFPNVIRVYMNFREADQRGIIYPVETSLSSPNNSAAHEGLQELLLDEKRQRVYASNSGMNRIEVFDIRRQRFIEPIEVGQLPHSMAMALDGNTLYVGNTGGESISIVDLDARRVVDNVTFPPIPRVGFQGSNRPVALGMALSGLQFIVALPNGQGTLWRLFGNTATPRPASSIISPTNTTTTTLAAPAQFSLAQTPGGEYLVAMAGNGNVYLYDALADSYTVGRTINTNPIQSYYGPAAGAPRGSFFLMNGLILSPALAVIGGAERPGQTQINFPTQPGIPPTQTVISTGQRHVAAFYPLSDTQFVRLTLPVRQNLASAVRDDARPVLELVDIRTGAESVVAVAPDNPFFTVQNTQRVLQPARQLVVDSNNTAYMISMAGLAVVPLQRTGTPPRPAITGGSRGILNANNGTTSFGPGSFITVSGANLAGAATADQVPLPTVLGGSCVTLSDVPLTLLQSSNGQITAQIPDNLRPGQYIAQVRSLATATQSEPIVITVQR